MGPRRTTGAANCGSADRLLSALPHLGMARSACLSPRRESPLRQGNSSPSAPKKQSLESGKYLTQFGHPRKTAGRASLRSDNCPIIPDQCPTISDWVSEFIGIRSSRGRRLDAGSGPRSEREQPRSSGWSPGTPFVHQLGGERVANTALCQDGNDLGIREAVLKQLLTQNDI